MQNKDEDIKTLWCGNLADQVTEELLYELFLQAGPLEKVRIPRDKDGRQKNFAFITYCHDVSVPYAIHLFRGTALFHKTLSIQSRARTVLLPPPIRCSTLDPSFGLTSQPYIKNQFESMMHNLKSSDNRDMHLVKQNNEHHDKLTVASLQGNWSHRHHPYRNDDIRQGHGKEDRHINGRSEGERHRDRDRNWRNRGRRDRNHGSHKNRTNHQRRS